MLKFLENPPFLLEDQRQSAFRYLEPYLSKNYLKVSVIWQKDKYSFGKIASISNVYIKEYLNKKMSTANFINLFVLDEIMPDPKSGNSLNSNFNNLNISDKSMQLAYALKEKADLYRLSREFNSALRLYNQSLDLDPNNAIVLFWIGDIYKNMNKNDIAKKYYEKALLLDPEFFATAQALLKLKS